VRAGASGLDVGAGRLDGASDELLLPSINANGAVAAFACSPIPPASERGSSSGEGSPRAERELLAGSPFGASLNDRDTARSFCEPSRDLTPWSSGGFRSTGEASDSGRFGVLEDGRGQMWSPLQVLDEGVNNFARRMGMATKRIRFNSGNRPHHDHSLLPSPTTDTGRGYPPKARSGSSGRTP